jgi:hypothetical protein
MLSADAPFEGPVANPPPPANTPIGSFGANCGSSFFVSNPDSPSTIARGAPPAPMAAGAPALEIHVTVTADEDDGNRNLDDISLREAILIANAGDADATIHLPAGTYSLTRPGRGEQTGGVGDLDIANPGHTTRILGAGTAGTLVRNQVDDRLFHVHAGSTVEIRGMSVEEGIEPNGGGIYNQGNLTLIDARVRLNFAHATGGGVANAPGAMLAIQQSTIAENISEMGGGISNELNGSITLSGSIVEKNIAAAGGGIHNYGGTVQLTTSTVRLNSASESGGGLVNLSKSTAAITTLTGTSVIDNHATNASLGSSLAQGGGICNSADGGSANAVVAITGGQVANNRAIAGNLMEVVESAAQGGGVFNRATGGNALARIVLTSVNVNANQATASALSSAEAAGGAIFSRAEDGESSVAITMSGGNMNANSATSSAGGGEGAVEPQSTARGGAIYNRARMDAATATLSATSVTLSSNSATASAAAEAEVLAKVLAEGGAVHNEAGVPSPTPNGFATASLVDSALRLNRAEANDGFEPTARGGAISNIGEYGNTVVDVLIANVENNRVRAVGAMQPSAQGGAIYNRVNSLSAFSRLAIERSTLRGNSADLVGAAEIRPRGGGLYTEGANVSIRDATLSANEARANGEGGAIFARHSLNIVNSTLSGNIAHKGGGLFVQTGAATVSNTTIAANSVSLDGGGIFADLVSDVGLRNTVVAKNFRTFENESPTTNDVAGPFDVESSYNWIGSGTGSTGINEGILGNRVGTTGASLEPFLGPLANNGGVTQTHLPLPMSPLIDGGEPAFSPGDFSPALTFDQRRESRVFDGNRDSIGRVDIGAVEARSTLFGDLDGDGRVSLTDVMILRRNFNAESPTYTDGDLNGDAQVNIRDLALMVEHFGSKLPGLSPQAPAAVVARDDVAGEKPEPVARARAVVRRPNEVGAPSDRSQRFVIAAVDRIIESPLEDITTLRARRPRR